MVATPGMRASEGKHPMKKLAHGVIHWSVIRYKRVTAAYGGHIRIARPPPVCPARSDPSPLPRFSVKWLDRFEVNRQFPSSPLGGIHHHRRVRPIAQKSVDPFSAVTNLDSSHSADNSRLVAMLKLTGYPNLAQPLVAGRDARLLQRQGR